MRDWLPINPPPKDEPIVVWHDHDSDPYWDSESENRLTKFGAWFEGFGASRLEPGPYVAIWGGGYEEDESGEGVGPYTDMPNWWFVFGSDFEQPLAPTHWMPLPKGAPR